MSILKTIYLQHLNGTSPNATLDANGNMTIAGTLSAGNPMGGMRNRIINGGMDIWQRGTSFTSLTGGLYGMDRWFNGGNISDWNLTADVPNSQFMYSASIASSGVNYGTITQRIEAINCIGLAGNSITLSFWYKSTVGSNPLFISLNYANSRDNYSGVTGFYTLSFTPVQNAWTYFTTTINNVPSGAANGIMVTLFRDNTGTATTYYTGVQLEVGTVATPFERRSFTTELQLCQRYYCKSYMQGSYAGDITLAGSVSKSPDSGSPTYMTFGTQSFPVEMRSYPTMTAYNPITGSSTNPVRNGNASTNHPLYIYNISNRNFSSYVDNSSVGQGNVCNYQWIAAIEL